MKGIPSKYSHHVHREDPLGEWGFNLITGKVDLYCADCKKISRTVSLDAVPARLQGRIAGYRTQLMAQYGPPPDEEARQ